MSELGTTQTGLLWITLILAIIFIALGIGLVSGAFLSNRIFMAGGLFRAGMITLKMKGEKRENRSAKKT